ncbi:hypothetical protein LA02_723 [Francisella philomiragia]|uniref:hypothetical protein n=1 Tax=Francisella philomiragia TaxID=28110 RepID=UPI0005A57216|nr:hypothetical protein [Francisella philomiragia]AJI57441.1 hypothetical protein LA02_723 [Francisella philomiragia]
MTLVSNKGDRHEIVLNSNTETYNFEYKKAEGVVYTLKASDLLGYNVELSGSVIVADEGGVQDISINYVKKNIKYLQEVTYTAPSNKDDAYTQVPESGTAPKSGISWKKSVDGKSVTFTCPSGFGIINNFSTDPVVYGTSNMYVGEKPTRINAIRFDYKNGVKQEMYDGNRGSQGIYSTNSATYYDNEYGSKKSSYQYLIVHCHVIDDLDQEFTRR